ncbi:MULTISPECIES: DUF5813 family protein [Halolamina]|uniref:Uncharacterized protein n=1 Tax=Halolamina pelagica TaxID=699431 RepID=A0A1I5UFY2_9EURY|nr:MULTISPECIES: DUF5813 family protein [Halolamina]NHX37259.1 hypothetical protein [Halolamina sp. R1-12]SFP94184.1 hypothetical protein SAMN05216277_11288 [Halolamina pelagica]
MSELPDRARRAFRDHDAFEADDDAPDRFIATATPFEGIVAASPADGGRIEFDVTVRAPMLDEVTEDDVAPVVEEGWYETFERRVGNVGGGVLAGDNVPDPAVTETTHQGRRSAEVTVSFADIDPRRGVNDAAALVDFVEGTYVQGVIPGYEYTEPVAGILAEARRAGGSDGVEQ